MSLPSSSSDYIGVSLYQADLITILSTRTTALENSAATQSALTTYITSNNTRLDAVEAKNVEQNIRLDTTDDSILNLVARTTALENSKVAETTFSDKMTTLDATDAALGTRVTATEGDINALTMRASGLEIRAASVEGRVSTLETGITYAVQTAIDSKVSQTTFDSIKEQLLDKDSELSAALATKVASTVQLQTDATQNELINSKVAQTIYDAKMSDVDSSITEHTGLITSLGTRMTTAESDIDVIEIRATTLEGRTTSLEGRTSTLDATKLNTSTYNDKIALIDTRDTVHDNRLDTIEYNATVLTNKVDGIDTTVNSLSTSKVDVTIYDTKMGALDITNTTHETRMSTIEESAATLKSRVNAHDVSIGDVVLNKVNVDTYNSKISTIEAKNTEQDSRLDVLDSLVSGAVTENLYNSKMSALDEKNTQQDGRLLAVEGRVTTLETGITSAVQTAIDTKVAQTTFDSIKTDLLQADSELATALATKVASTIQAQTDEAQNELINSKVAQSVYDTKITSIDTLLEGLQTDVSGLNTSKATQSDVNIINGKIAAIEEFIGLFLQTYSILKTDGSSYSYTGSVQAQN